jgi:Cu+-exporting ATPase
MNGDRVPAGEPAVLSITGMTCGGCVASVERVLKRVPGVTGVEVDLAGGRATVAGPARPQELVEAVQRAGFGAQLG